MTTKNLAIVGLRLLAIYCFVQSVPRLTMFSFERVAFLAGGSLLLLAVLLYAFSEPMAQRLAPAETTEPKEMVCTFEQLQTIAFAVAGILILVTAILAFIQALWAGLASLFRHLHDVGPFPFRESRFSWPYFIGEIAQVVAGLALLLNPQGFRNVWHRLRAAGA